MKPTRRIGRRRFLQGSALGIGASPLLANAGPPAEVAPSAPAPPQSNSGTLELTVTDEGSDRPVPARVELLDAEGHGHAAQDALPIDGDCVDREIPADYTLERAVAVMSKNLINPYNRKTQFYSVGKSVSSLPPGEYHLKISKGPEYRVQERTIQIRSGETANLTVEMTRWVNMPANGWYSADDHLHIARPVEELNPFLSKWMQAEDVHIGNLLQWGLQKRFHNALQYSFGEPGVYREGDYLIAAGQENPRTHFLGHAIILGGRTPINFPEAYVIYQLFFKEAQKQGAIAGYAHFGISEGARYGISIDLPTDTLNFLEVLQFEHLVYNVWYDALNLGFRITPTAGTDYPCAGVNLPGRERFYAKVDGPLTYTAWLEAVRKGRTFVTNGPMLEFRVNGRDVGDEIDLKKPGTVTIEGKALFDPKRDEVQRVELVVNGTVVASFPRAVDVSEIDFRFSYEVRETCWIAARASGIKIDEPSPPDRPFLILNSGAVAHSAAIYVTVEGSPPLTAQPRAREVAREWLSRLSDLETRLAEDRIQTILQDPQAADGVEADHLEHNREALLQAIQAARAFFIKVVG